MADTADNQNRRRRFSFFKRGLRISDHQEGDIQSDAPVIIQHGAVVVGDVIAPKIKVTGLLRGTAVAHRLIVTTNGQIWGDVHATQLKLEPGGKIQGWVSQLPPDAPLFPPSQKANDNNEQLETLRQLQSEAGDALAAHANLTNQFETRLMEKAGDAFDKINTLSQELEKTQQNLNNVQQQLSDAQTAIAERDMQIIAQEDTLAAVQAMAQRQQETFTILTQTHEQITNELSALKTAKENTDFALLKTQRQVNALTERNESLETALQASIQRSAEQEDALLHWQELANTAQEKMEEAGKEQLTLQRQLEESALITGNLREKISRLEAEWQATLQELDELRAQASDATAAELQFALADAQEQIGSLKQSAAESDEQILWYKANLRTTQRMLEQNRRITERQEGLLIQLQEQALERETAVDKWKTAVEQMAARLQDREKQLEAAQAEFDDEKMRLETAVATLDETVRHKSLQLDSLENEIEQYLKQMDRQGEHLAEIQATLVERELQLKGLKGKVIQQREFIQKMKHVAGERIQKLEAQLTQAKRLLKQKQPQS